MMWLLRRSFVMDCRAFTKRNFRFADGRTESGVSGLPVASSATDLHAESPDATKKNAAIDISGVSVYDEYG